MYTNLSALPLDISEKDFQQRVMDHAKWHRWRVVHIRPALHRSGRISTPYSGDTGLPDLILARDGVVLLVELKTEKGRATREQLRWLDAAGANGYLWRPSDWGIIQDVLGYKHVA
ncbi:VRR-NUC domain-containing protein [Nocardia sp. 004]|uniref:VRR-NUC domain-containing protein n=1 Tax=Nocardia sp. 004 TaxID=3385978 RepID=UPI0039A3E2EB